MPPSKPKLDVSKVTLDVAKMADALHLNPAQIASKFQDPRVTSWFAELWGEKLYNYRAHASANQQGSDASFSMGSLGDLRIGVRCFKTNTLKFQKSKFIGSGRSATEQDLENSLDELDRYVIVDLRQFPQLDFYPLDTKTLLRLVREGKLTTSGITPRRFDAWIAETFAVTISPATL